MSTISTISDTQSSGESDNEIILPALREDINLLEGPRKKDGSPTWTLHDPVRNKYFRIGWLEFEILARWDANIVSKLVKRINGETTLHTSNEYIHAFLDFLRTNQLLKIHEAQGIQFLCNKRSSLRKTFFSWFLQNYLFIRIPICKPDRFLEATLPYIRFVYSRKFFLVFIAITLLGLYLSMRNWDVFQSTFLYFFSVEGLTLFLIAVFLAKIVHELGHAYTAKLYGLKVPTMGVAFLVLWPVLYTDTSDAWKLPNRRQRLSIAAAGMLAEIGLAGIATLIWSFLPDGPVRSAVFMVATTTWIITLLVNSNPFLRFDGYYFLSDFLEVQNFQDRSFMLARWKLREIIFGFGEACPDNVPERTMKIMMIYAYGTWLYRLTLFITIALLVYFLFFKIAGIFLMLVEIGWFIAKPVTNEIKVWMSMRNKIQWNRNTITSVAISGGFFLMLIIPWNTYLSLPALLKYEEHTRIYATTSAQIKEVKINHGDTVKKGQTLFILESPELENKIHQSALKVNILQLQLSRQSTQGDYLDNRIIIQNQLAEAITEHQGYMQLQDQLQITAPFDGEIVELDGALAKGRWINNKLPLALLVSKENVVIETYLTEKNLDRISIGNKGLFYAENTDQKPLDVRLTEVDNANTTVLDEPYHASTYGGDIAVSQDRQGRLMVNETLYRVIFLPDESTIQAEQLSRGTVRIKGTPESLLMRAWKQVSAVLLRESGF